MIRILPSQRTPGEGHPAAGRLRVASLAEALLAEYRTDAHVVAYAADDSPTGDRRLVQASLTRGARPRMVLGLVDVDSPQEHRGEDGEASPAWRADQAARVARLRVDVPGLVEYETRKGYRLVGLLPEPVVIASVADAARWRATYLRRLAVLARLYGIVGDAACSDWTRLYRLPHATRTPAHGPEHRPLRGDPHRLGAWPALVDAPEALVADVATLRSTWGDRVAAHVAPAPPAAPRAPRSRATVAPAIVADLGRLYGAARELAEALAELPRGLGERHGAILACVGALVDAGWTAAAVRRVMGDVADALGDARDEVASAINATLRRRDAQLPYTGLATLRELSPRAAEALRSCETPAERARRALGAIPQPAELTPDEASRELAEALREAREAHTLSVLAVTTGAGKTHAACEDARDAARAGRRTAILACSHAVAAETVERLRAWGVAAAHLRGVLSVVDASGLPVCRHAESAEALASAGVGTVSTMCDGDGYATRTPRGQRRLTLYKGGAPKRVGPACEHRSRCEAYKVRRREREALAEAQVLVTVHALADDAHRWLAEAPEGALAVIDEAPELLVASALTAAELAAAAEAIGARRSAVTRAEAWRADVLRAAARGLSAAPEGASVAQVLRAGLAVAEGSLVATLPDDAAVTDLLARWARDSGQTRTGRPRRQIAPRPARRVVDEARRRAGVPPQVVDAIRVAGLVARALAAELAGGPSCASAVGTREHGEGSGARELRLTATAAPLRALLADASVGRVVLDATAPPSPDLLAAAAGVPVETVATRTIAVRDGAPVERIYVPWSHASRRACLPGGVPEWSELRGPLREGLRLAAEGLPRGARLLAVTWQVVTRAIAAAPDAELAAELASLAERGITVEWAHYGATRGVDRWRDVDAVVAVGTPWPDESAVAQVVAASGLPAEGTRELARHLARAELAQVIGRLRAPRRTRDARVVVVASAAPLGADARWQVRELAGGRPPRAVAVPEGVTHAAAAAAAGVSRSTIKRRRREAREAREAEGGGSKPVTEAYVTGCEPPPSRGAGDTNRRKIGRFERRPLEPDTPDPPLGDAPLVARAAPVPVPEARARSG